MKIPNNEWVKVQYIMIKDKEIFDYSTDGAYVDDRSRLTVFFQVFMGKFWKLMGANVAFLALNIPALIISFLLSSYIVDLLPITLEANEGSLMLSLVIGFPIMLFFMAVPVITVGPVQAGLTYILKSYSYEIPNFFWYDFKAKAKENFKQSLIVSLINFAAIAFLLVDLYLYKQIASTLSGAIMPIAYGVIFILLIIVLMMAMYIYPMMVSYELSIKNIYKNAFLLSIGRFLPNLIILIILFMLIMAPMLIVISTESYLALTMVYFYYTALGFTLPGLVINSFINPIIDKYLRPDESKAEADTDASSKIRAEADTDSDT